MSLASARYTAKTSYVIHGLTTAVVDTPEQFFGCNLDDLAIDLGDQAPLPSKQLEELKTEWEAHVLHPGLWTSEGSTDTMLDTILIPGALLAAGDVGLRGVRGKALSTAKRPAADAILPHEGRPTATGLLHALEPDIMWHRKRGAPEEGTGASAGVDAEPGAARAATAASGALGAGSSRNDVQQALERLGGTPASVLEAKTMINVHVGFPEGKFDWQPMQASKQKEGEEKIKARIGQYKVQQGQSPGEDLATVEQGTSQMAGFGTE